MVSNVGFAMWYIISDRYDASIQNGKETRDEIMEYCADGIVHPIGLGLDFCVLLSCNGAPQR